MRILYVGSVLFSEQCLQKLFSMQQTVVGIISSPNTGINADYVCLKPLADERSIPYYETTQINAQETLHWAKSRNADVVFCFGWSRLLKKEFLGLAPLGVVGYHPALLPNNRGRHPVIWALALGLNETGSTFFFMDEGADTGDIIHQVPVEIREDDTALELYYRIMQKALLQIEEWIPQLQKNTHNRIPQDKLAGNSWRKRGRLDGQIDWRMSSESIYNLVRALSKPYPGAHFLVNNQEYKVRECRIVDDKNINFEPGKVLKNELVQFWIKTGNGAVVLVDHDFPGKVLPEYI